MKIHCSVGLFHDCCVTNWKQRCLHMISYFYTPSLYRHISFLNYCEWPVELSFSPLHISQICVCFRVYVIVTDRCSAWCFCGDSYSVLSVLLPLQFGLFIGSGLFIFGLAFWNIVLSLWWVESNKGYAFTLYLMMNGLWNFLLLFVPMFCVVQYCIASCPFICVLLFVWFPVHGI